MSVPFGSSLKQSINQICFSSTSKQFPTKHHGLLCVATTENNTCFTGEFLNPFGSHPLPPNSAFSGIFHGPFFTHLLQLDDCQFFQTCLTETTARPGQDRHHLDHGSLFGISPGWDPGRGTLQPMQCKTLAAESLFLLKDSVGIRCNETSLLQRTNQDHVGWTRLEPEWAW